MFPALLISVERDYFTFKDGVTPETVQKYLDNLKKFKAEFSVHGWTYKNWLFYSSDLYEKIMAATEQEIKLCEFYLEQQDKLSYRAYSAWTFIPKDKQDRQSFREPQDQYVKTNGKVKATITVDDSGKMLKITLEYRNDNQYLDFTSYEEAKDHFETTHVKTAWSVSSKVGLLKSKAERFLREHELPLWWTKSNSNKERFHEVQQFEIFKKLLHIGEEKSTVCFHPAS